MSVIRAIDLVEQYSDTLPHICPDGTAWDFSQVVQPVLDIADPDMLIWLTKRGNRPIKTVCLFSGGHDSTVVAHRCIEHYDTLVFIDTGTAAPGVVDHVKETAEWLDKPLLIFSAKDAYARMVLGGWVRPNGTIAKPLGFPGPAAHSTCYRMLKERRIEWALAQFKRGYPRNSRVVFLSGVRRDESQRRAKRPPITRRGGAVFCNPLIAWTNEEMRLYRVAHALPESDAAALTHRSSECNCGAYAKPGEREDLMQFYPAWWAKTIAPLEAEAKAMGLKHCTWGSRFTEDVPADVEADPLCTDCVLRIQTAQAYSPYLSQFTEETP